MKSFYEILNESKDYKIVKWYTSGKGDPDKNDEFYTLPVVPSKYYYELWNKLTESMLEDDKREVMYLVYRETDNMVGFKDEPVQFRYTDTEHPIIGQTNSTNSKMYTADKKINAVDPFYFRKSPYDNGYRWNTSLIVGISLPVRIDNTKTYKSVVDTYTKDNNLLYEMYKGGSFSYEKTLRRTEIVLYPMEMRGAISGKKFGI